MWEAWKAWQPGVGWWSPGFWSLLLKPSPSVHPTGTACVSPSWQPLLPCIIPPWDTHSPSRLQPTISSILTIAGLWLVCQKEGCPAALPNPGCMPSSAVWFDLPAGNPPLCPSLPAEIPWVIIGPARWTPGSTPGLMLLPCGELTVGSMEQSGRLCLVRCQANCPLAAVAWMELLG